MFPEHYVRALEAQQQKLEAAVHTMYYRLLAANAWPGPRLMEHDGNPLLHDVLVVLGLLESTNESRAQPDNQQPEIEEPQPVSPSGCGSVVESPDQQYQLRRNSAPTSFQDAISQGASQLPNRSNLSLPLVPEEARWFGGIPELLSRTTTGVHALGAPRRMDFEPAESSANIAQRPTANVQQGTQSLPASFDHQQTFVTAEGLQNAAYHYSSFGDMDLNLFEKPTDWCRRIAFRFKGFQDGIATLARGEQDSIATISTAYHLLINILSTVLLSSSSYTMQILSSPTRPEVDPAHDEGQWLDIGLLSTRNLGHIDRKRLKLWFILAASSVPLHLFYNAAVFKYTVALEYDARFVNYLSEDYLKLNTSGAVSNLTNAQWMSVFGSDFVYDYTDLHIVFDAVGTASGLTGLSDPISISIDTSWPQPHWSFSANDSSDIRYLNKSGQEWLATGQGYHVHAMYAFAHPASGQNEVQLRLHFMLIVIVANLVKAVVMGSVVLKTGLVDGSSYLVTCGDAVASFLACPDSNTKGLSTASKLIMLGIAERDRCDDDRPERVAGGTPVVEGYAWKPQQHCMGSAMTSPRMLWWCNTMLIASSFGGALLIGYSDTFSGWGTSS
ncbi:hypothetical protein KCU61_g3045, partial [Aureobasidium melanogenum]